MNSECRDFLRKHIQVHLEKNPDSSVKDVKNWLMSGEQKFDLKLVNSRTLRMFIKYQKDKFSIEGQCTQHSGGNGRPAVPGQTVGMIKRLMLNKKRRSGRTVGARLKLHPTTIYKVMKKHNIRPFHKRKVQGMKPEHKIARVSFARWALRTYGRSTGPGTIWRRLLNSDFSAFVKVGQGNLNTKNDVIWSHSINEAGDLLDHQQEKYSVSLMIFGAVSVRGLLPPESPIFVDQLLSQWEPKPKSVNGQIYADMNKTDVGPAAKVLYPRGDGVWQDDPATIHRCPAAIDAVAESFKFRVPHDKQAPKMADVWPIENVWAIIKQKVKESEPANKEALRKTIVKVWREINDDKALLARLIFSIPRRLQAVILNNGDQIRPNEY